jgi:DNA-binding PadR family transcriptional regulator
MTMKPEPRPSVLGLMILGMLTEEPMHPYRMQKLIRMRKKDNVVNVRQRASVHQTLARLLHLGLVVVRQKIRTRNHPDRTVYAITSSGRKTTIKWLRTMLTSVGTEFPEFPAAVSVIALLKPRDARKQLELRAEAVRHKLSELEAEIKGATEVPRLFLLEGEYQIALLKTELKWLEAVIGDFRTGALDWNLRWLKKIAAQFNPVEQDSIRKVNYE